MMAIGVHLTISEEKLKFMDQLIAKEPLQHKGFHLLLQEHGAAFQVLAAKAYPQEKGRNAVF